MSAGAVSSPPGMTNRLGPRGLHGQAPSEKNPITRENQQIACIDARLCRRRWTQERAIMAG